VVEVHRIHGPVGLGERAGRLHHQLGDGLLDLGALDLQHGDVGARRLPAAPHLVEEAQVGDLERHQLDLHSREPVAEAGVLHERAPVLHLLAGQLLQLRELALGGADAAGAHALVAQQVLGHRPALAFLVHEVLDGDLDLVEEDLVDLLAAVHRAIGRTVMPGVACP
jgi:hypothetical protein